MFPDFVNQTFICHNAQSLNCMNSEQKDILDDDNEVEMFNVNNEQSSNNQIMIVIGVGFR